MVAVKRCKYCRNVAITVKKVCRAARVVQSECDLDREAWVKVSENRSARTASPMSSSAESVLGLKVYNAN